MFQRKNKYGAKSCNGFPSKLESGVYDLLVLKMGAGEIRDIKRQQVTSLTLAKINYKVDFTYIDCSNDALIWVEAKGFPTDAWKLKKRLWKFYGPGELHVYGGNYRCLRLMEKIIPTTNKEK